MPTVTQECGADAVSKSATTPKAPFCRSGARSGPQRSKYPWERPAARSALLIIKSRNQQLASCRRFRIHQKLSLPLSLSLSPSLSRSLLISGQIDARSLVPLITGESMPRSSVGASAAVSSSAGQTLMSGNRPRGTRYPAPMERETNKKEPARKARNRAAEAG
jgi:hypothetical protein